MTWGNYKYLIVIALLVGTILFSQLRSDGKLVPIVRSLDDFPKQIADWRGEPYRFSQFVYDKLGVDSSIAINYENDNGDEVSMYVGYYESQGNSIISVEADRAIDEITSAIFVELDKLA